MGHPVCLMANRIQKTHRGNRKKGGKATVICGKKKEGETARHRRQRWGRKLAYSEVNPKQRGQPRTSRPFFGHRGERGGGKKILHVPTHAHTFEAGKKKILHSGREVVQKIPFLAVDRWGKSDRLLGEEGGAASSNKGGGGEELIAKYSPHRERKKGGGGRGPASLTTKKKKRENQHNRH